MGGGTFGIAAAADFYFGKKVTELTLAEAAMLAGLFKAPAKYAPHVNLPAARARANVVLSNLVDAGFMSEGQVLPARLQPATVIDRGTAKSPDYFLDFAFDEVKRVAADTGLRSLVARTTLDLRIQKAAEEAMEYNLRQHGADYGVSEGAIVVLDTDGSVRAIVGGRDYGESQFNRATKALRQTGSSFKPYVFAAAMEAGFEPDSIVSDGPISWGGWSPQNYGRSFSGRMTLATALIRSVNTVPVRLAKDHLSLKPIETIVAAMGIETPLNGHKTMVLGTSGMTVMDQATGYNVFAAGGFAGTRHAVTQVLSRGGNVVYDWSRDAPPPHRVLSEKAVASMNSILVRIPEIGTARRAALEGIRSGGKTGTTQSYRDAWYIGFTGNYTAAVWLGNDDFTPSNDMTGGSLPAMVWQRVMTDIHRGVELKPIPGIAEPYVDPLVAAKAAEAERQRLAALPTDPDVPPVLAPETADALRTLAERLHGAALRLEAPGSDRLSAL